MPKPRRRAAPPLPELNYPQTPFDGLLFAADEKRRWRVCARFVSKRRRITRAARLPGRGRTSRLSPCSPSACCPRQCLHRLLTEHPAALDGGAGATGNELIWREFYRHLMVYYPKLCKGRPFTADR